MEKSLEQLRYLQGEIDILQEFLSKLENTVVTDVVTGSWPNFPYIEQRQKITGVPQDAPVIRTKKRLKEKMAQLLSEQERLLAWILEINDSEIRQILTLRYINGHSWRVVAQKIGYADESVPRKRCARFLTTFENDRKIRNEVC